MACLITCCNLYEGLILLYVPVDPLPHPVFGQISRYKEPALPCLPSYVLIVVHNSSVFIVFLPRVHLSIEINEIDIQTLHSQFTSQLTIWDNDEFLPDIL